VQLVRRCSHVEWIIGEFGCWDYLSVRKDEFLPRWLSCMGAWVVAGAYARCGCAVSDGGGDAPCGDALFELVVVVANNIYSRLGVWLGGGLEVGSRRCDSVVSCTST
jgi:hypothetical protein